MEIDMTGKSKSAITKHYLGIWDKKLRAYLERTKTKPTSTAEEAPAPQSMYQHYRDMQHIRRLVFQILKSEIVSLHMPVVYNNLLSFAHHAGNEEYKDWFIKKVLLAKYEKKLTEIAELDIDLFTLRDQVKGLSVDDRIGRTKKLLSQKEGNVYVELSQGLEELPLMDYLVVK